MKHAIVGILAVGLALVSLAVAGCAGPRRVSDKDLRPIDLPGLLGLIERQASEPGKRRLLILDARRPEMWEQGKIPGARHLLLSDLDPELGRDRAYEGYDDIVVYGQNPGSTTAPALAKRMMRMRYDDVRLFEGGVDAWTRAGLELAPTAAP